MAESSRITNDQIDAIVQEFFTSQLALRGNEWVPRTPQVPASNGGDMVDGPIGNGHAVNGNATSRTLDTATKKKIKDALASLAQRLRSEFNDRIVNMVTQLPEPSQMNYSSFESLANEMFCEGSKWSLIVTLMTFAVELIHHIGVTNGSEQYIEDVFAWTTRYLSRPAVLNWINDQGWESLIAFAEARAEGANQADDQDPEFWGSRLLALSGAIGVVLGYCWLKI